MGTWERFWSKVEIRDLGYATPCWVWTGALRNGYAHFAIIKGQQRYGHRLAREMLVGPLTSGLEIDHLCRNHACVRPTHTEEVTHAENMARADSHWRRQSTCVKGHPFDGHSARGQRTCSVCARERRRAYKQRKRAAA